MKTNNFILRAITGILFVAAIIAGLTLHVYGYTILFALIAAMTTWEFCTIVNKGRQLQVNRFITSVAAVYLFLAMEAFVFGIMGAIVFIPYLITIIYLMVSELYFDRKNNIENWAFSFMSQMYVALPFALLTLLFGLGITTGLEYEWGYQLCVFIFLWASDTGAYCIGSLIGKNKLFPRISPGKSWEGSIGGTVVAIACSQIIATYYNFASSFNEEQSRIAWAGLALVIVIFGTWGDLCESLLKRRIGIKDSGNILPGHGGMLDRFDSSLLAIPAAVIYIYTIILNF